MNVGETIHSAPIGDAERNVLDFADFFVGRTEPISARWFVDPLVLAHYCIS